MKMGQSLPVSDIDESSLQHDLNFVVLRRLWEGGMSQKDVLDLTRKVDQHYIKRVLASKNDSEVVKRAIQLVFKGKALHEDWNGKPLFVKNSNPAVQKDPSVKEFPYMELDFGMKGAFGLV